MLQDILTIGDKIDIRQMNHSGELMRHTKTYVSQLVDFIDTDVIHIATPIGSNRIIILYVGENYNLCFYTNKGLYQCTCVVMNYYKENNMIIAVVKLTSDLEKFQRRQYYRLECVLEMEYRAIGREEEILEKRLLSDDFGSDGERLECRNKLDQLNQAWQKATITDLSGGGARFNSASFHESGETVRIRFDIFIGNKLKKFSIGAKVVASTKLLDHAGVYEQRVEFNDIGTKDRDYLIKYIFEQDRKKRKNDKN